MDQKTILIIDDQTEVIRTATARLKARHEHYRVINANNGLVGCEVAISQLPDVILMDWDMPVMNGIEATRKLRNNEDTHDIPIIMATGQMTSSQDLDLALSAGATDYIRKPIDFIELSARINTAIRIREQYIAIRKLLENDIELKNRKLSTTSMLIIEKNGTLSEFHQHLKDLQEIVKSGPEVTFQKIEQLKKRIVNHIEMDKSWDTFKLHFEEVNPNFFKTIKQLSPDLSFKDQKLAAYVKMGMDNKQIAQLLNITYASIRTALSRLKKKLEIAEDDNLRSVIDEIK